MPPVEEILIKQVVQATGITQVSQYIIRQLPDVDPVVVMPQKDIVTQYCKFKERHVLIELQSDILLDLLKTLEKLYAPFNLFPETFQGYIRGLYAPGT
jgi:hypothetical protein